MSEAVTIQTMCETIAKSKLLVNKYGADPTAEEIYKYSATGELYMIFHWYREALAKEALTKAGIQV